MTNRRAQKTGHSFSNFKANSISRSAMHAATAVAMSLALAGFAGSTLAAGTSKSEAIKDETTLKAASLAATCANCHNTGGKGVDGAAVLGLSYLKSSYIESQMLSFKRGEREATVMHQLSKGYTDEQIKIIADYLGQK